MALIKRLAIAGNGLLNRGITRPALSVTAAATPKPSLMIMMSTTPAANKDDDDDDDNAPYCRNKSGRFFLAITSFKGHEMKETSEALHLKVEMPGLSKDDVKVLSNKKMVRIIEGDDEDNKQHYVFPNHFWFKAERTTAKMNKGVLELIIPSIKEEHRKPLFNLKIN